MTQEKYSKFFLHRGLRKTTDSGTIGSLFGVDRLGRLHFICNTLEPYKVVTPAGTYSVMNTFSPRFNRYLPLLCCVPGHSGIRIHVGNTTKDTSGCILVGQFDCVANTVINSKVTFDRFLSVAKFPFKLVIFWLISTHEDDSSSSWEEKTSLFYFYCFIFVIIFPLLFYYFYFVQFFYFFRL